MTIASKLLQYIFFAPDDVKQKCSLFRKTQLELNQDEPVFNYQQEYNYDGFIIKGDTVKVYGIIIWDANNWKDEKYLDISNLIPKLLNHYNIFHCFTILKYCLGKYYRENVLTENYILFFQNYDKRFKHKFRYEVTKHRGRERKYIEGYWNKNNTKWNRILYQSAIKKVYSSYYGQYKRERFNSIMLDYQTKPEQLILQNKHNKSNGL